jgi:pentafunctional AROM polypeptide
VEGIELMHDDASASGIASCLDSSASVLIIGMRGSGKTFVGRSASEILGWPFVDADEYFVQVHKTGVKQFVHDKGWPAFRKAETEILKEIISTYGKGHVISLGGGIVETPAARDTLKKYAATQGPVVYVVREIDEIVAYLGSETARPAYGESVTDVFARRKPWYSECSNYEFVNYTGLLQAAADVSLSVKRGTREEIRRFFQHITSQNPNLSSNLIKGKRSYFLSLTYPDLTPALAHIDALSAGVDAIELRVDLLRAPADIDIRGAYISPPTYVATQLAALRRVSSLPIVYTVRSISQGGSFPDTAKKEAFELFNLGLRLGAEYVDVEITWPEKAISGLTKRKGSSKIITSYHDWSGNLNWSGPVVKEKHRLASKLGDIVKIVGKANKMQDNFELYDFRESVTAQQNAKPLIAINMGQEGQISRILNPTFSPVTHPLLPSKAAPGQVSFVEIQKALHLLGLLPAKQFYIFGNPITYSMSPTLHNTAFETLGLPHHYQILETETMIDNAEIKAVLERPEFGGASVTIPFKLDVISLLDTLSPAAKAIGAVNTIIPVLSEDVSSRTLHGDNTDWIGISESVRTKLELLITNITAPATTSPEPSLEPLTVPEAGLVIGAGGTARAALYALHKLGVKNVYLYNRTESKARALADEFSSTINISNAIRVVRQLDSWPEGIAPSVIVSTIPASGQTEIALTNTLFSGASRGGVVVDMAYKPAETPLLKLAKDAAPSWQLVTGVEVLLEQGYKQFELWTGRRAPRDMVAKEVFMRYNAT